MEDSRKYGNSEYLLKILKRTAAFRQIAVLDKEIFYMLLKTTNFILNQFFMCFLTLKNN